MAASHGVNRLKYGEKDMSQFDMAGFKKSLQALMEGKGKLRVEGLEDTNPTKVVVHGVEATHSQAFADFATGLHMQIEHGPMQATFHIPQT